MASPDTGRVVGNVLLAVVLAAWIVVPVRLMWAAFRAAPFMAPGTAEEETRRYDLYAAAGISGVVIPAAGLVVALLFRRRVAAWLYGTGAALLGILVFVGWATNPDG